MELEAHIDRLKHSAETMVAGHEAVVDEFSVDPNLGPFHPRVIRAEAVFAKSVAKGFFELARLAPCTRTLLNQ